MASVGLGKIAILHILVYHYANKMNAIVHSLALLVCQSIVFYSPALLELTHDSDQVTRNVYTLHYSSHI